MAIQRSEDNSREKQSRSTLGATVKPFFDDINNEKKSIEELREIVSQMQQQMNSYEKNSGAVLAEEIKELREQTIEYKADRIYYKRVAVMSMSLQVLLCVLFLFSFSHGVGY